MAVHNDAIISGNQILNRGKELFENEKRFFGVSLDFNINGNYIFFGTIKKNIQLLRIQD